MCKAILENFQQEYLVCPTDPEEWRGIEKKFRNRWNVPHAVGALAGKHIAMKPKKSGNEYFNYKGYISLVLLALVKVKYKFLWLNVGSSGSSSDAQIFNNSQLRRKIENGTLWLPPPEPLGPLGPNRHYFLLGDNAFALIPWLVKPYSRRQLTQGERIADYRISRGRRVVENAFGILVGRFRVLLTTMEQRPEVVRLCVLTFVVLHNMLRRHQGGADRPTTPADDLQPPQADQAANGPNGNFQNPSREAKHQQDLLKDYFNNLGALDGQGKRFKKTEKTTSCHLSVLFRTTQLSQELLFYWSCKNIKPISKPLSSKSQHSFTKFRTHF